MGSGNVEIVLDIYAATNARDWGRTRRAWAEDVELEVVGPAIISGSYRGVETVARWFADWFGQFEDDARFEVREVIEPDDDHVLAVSDHRARGRTSGAMVEMRVAWLYRFRDGEIVRMELHPTRESAVAAREG